VARSGGGASIEVGSSPEQPDRESQLSCLINTRKSAHEISRAIQGLLTGEKKRRAHLKSAQNRRFGISPAAGAGKVTSCFSSAHTAARVRGFEAHSNVPLASSEARKVARTVISRRPTRASLLRAPERRRRADLDNHNGPPHAQERSQLQQRRRAVAEEGETRVVRGPEQRRAGVERQAARPGQRYVSWSAHVNAPRYRHAPPTSTRRFRADRTRLSSYAFSSFHSRRFERFRRRFSFAHFFRAFRRLFVSRIDAREPTRLNSTRPARSHTTTKTKLRSK